MHDRLIFEVKFVRDSASKTISRMNHICRDLSSCLTNARHLLIRLVKKHPKKWKQHVPHAKVEFQGEGAAGTELFLWPLDFSRAMIMLMVKACVVQEHMFPLENVAKGNGNFNSRNGK